MTDDEIESAAWRDVGAERGGDKMASAMTNHDRQTFIRGARVARRSMLAEREEMLAGLRLAVWLLADISPQGLVKQQLDELIAKVTRAAS